MLDTWVQQYLGRLPSSRSDTSGAQIEELPSESMNTFREDGKCSVRACVGACVCVYILVTLHTSTCTVDPWLSEPQCSQAILKVL